MRVILRFQNPYDKYLFEGIIDPSDYYYFTGSNVEEIKELETISLYVLNTIDKHEDIELLLDKFFASMTTSPVKKNLLLLSPQSTVHYDKIIMKFSNIEKTLRPSEEVVIYGCNSTHTYNFLKLYKHNDLIDTINSYSKHLYIDLNLAMTAIELFNRRKICTNYDLYKISDKKVKSLIFPFLPHALFLKNLPNIQKILNRDDDPQNYNNRIINYIPKYTFRIRDIIESFMVYNHDKPCILILENVVDIKYNIDLLKHINFMTIYINNEIPDCETYYNSVCENFTSENVTKPVKLNSDYVNLYEENEYNNVKNITIHHDCFKNIIVDSLDSINKFVVNLDLKETKVLRI